MLGVDALLLLRPSQISWVVVIMLPQIVWYDAARLVEREGA